jgi:hypothetical protein
MTAFRVCACTPAGIRPIAPTAAAAANAAADFLNCNIPVRLPYCGFLFARIEPLTVDDSSPRPPSDKPIPRLADVRYCGFLFA